ncbi:MAG: hypothetical protein PHU08_00020 [Dehalococcoidales bacterium]|nr:hypothetical protein [Dehalococcoidales bacterium]
MARFYRGNSAPRQVRGNGSWKRKPLTREEVLANMEVTLDTWTKFHGEDSPIVQRQRERIAEFKAASNI